MEDQAVRPSSSSYKREELDYDFPPNKKIKVVSTPKQVEKLEERLNHILSCSVCLDLPTSACMQCCHGHLMCVGCYHHLLADSRLKDEQATCPTCRVDISRGSCTRNLAVEKTISELPVQCTSCCSTYSRSSIMLHMLNDCVERVVSCQLQQLGCAWSGPAHELENHIKICTHTSKSPSELLHCLDAINKQQKEQISSLHNVVSLLSCEHISYMEIQLRPYRTDDFVTKLFYESSRFHLMGHTWAIKAYVSAAEQQPSNPTSAAVRKLSYQMFLKSKLLEPLEVEFMLLRAPYDDVQIQPKPSYNKFTCDIGESPVLPLDTNDVNRLIGSKVINLRLFMFQHKR